MTLASLLPWRFRWLRKHQQKCSPPPGKASHPSRPRLGEHEYRGYQEWAVHPLEAELVLSRGYAIVDGRKRRVIHIEDEAFCSVIWVEGSDPAYVTDSLEEAA